MTNHQIEKLLLKLDIHSRAKLAAKLLISLEELSDTENEKLWAKEALLRHKEIIKSKVKPKAARIVFEKARVRLY